MRTCYIVMVIFVMMMTIVDVNGAIQSMTSYQRDPCESPGCNCRYEVAECACDNNIQSISLIGQQGKPIRRLNIENCKHVHIAENTIKNLTMLAKLEIRNVENLMLARTSLHGGHWYKKLSIKISNSTIENLHSYVFQGNLSDIHIENSRILQISAYAFSSITSPYCQITISNTKIKKINQQAFNRIQLLGLKFEKIEIEDNLPSKILSEVEVLEDFSILDSKFGVVKSSAINVALPLKVDIRNSYFEVLEGEAFVISSRGKIEFRNNTISDLHNGAFRGLGITNDILRNYGKQEFIFEDNTVDKYNPGGFWTNVTSLNTRYGEVKLNEKCTCEIINRILIPKSSVQCSIVDPHHYQNLPPNYVEVPKYENAQKIYELECRVFGTAPWYIWLLGTLGILIFLILIGGLTLWWCKKHRSNNQKQWINNGTGKKFNPQQIVMPEPKTYRETELHVIVERAELLTTDL